MPTIDTDGRDFLSNLRVARMPTLLRMLWSLERNPRPGHGLNRAIDLFLAEFHRPAAVSRPFLSVILRTQGSRHETFKDSLLCLAGQSVEDFEVLVVCHDADADDFAFVEDTVASQPAGFRDRISVLKVTGGRRAKPLNVALERARGRYLAFYDDDDLLFGHWVETFARAAERVPGKMLRTKVAMQRAVHEIWPTGEDGFRHLSWPGADYPAEFDQLAHLRMNYSPFMGWAFPRHLFDVLGLRFDEELYVCEDWDMILRGSLLCDVEEINELTAVYRRWEGRESSYTAHDATQWHTSQDRVVAKLDENPVVMPPGTVVEIRSLLDDRDELMRVRAQLHALVSSRGWRYAAPIRAALRLADYGRRAVRRAALEMRTRSTAG